MKAVRIEFKKGADLIKIASTGKNYLEFQYMAEAGMPPIEAIKASTVSAAELLGVSDERGTISINKMADIIAVSGHPSKDIKVPATIDFIMKEGKIYKQ